MNSFPIRFHGFLNVSGTGSLGGVPGVLGVSPQALTLRTDEGKTVVTLLPSEVVAITKAPLSHRLVVNHIAFEKIGTVEIDAIDETPDQLIQRIRCVGFIPQAEEVREWDPAQGPPPSE